MQRIFHARALSHSTVLGAVALALSGCGGGSAFSISAQPTPISITLPISTVVLSQNGAQVTVPILITSTSETALVMVGGLPAGVQEKYAASDTNPSGILAFTANKSAPTGTYMPIITVISANQTVSTTFTLIVKTT